MPVRHKQNHEHVCETGSFWGLTEFKANIPVLMSTVMNKAKGEDGSTIPEEWDDGL